MLADCVLKIFFDILKSYNPYKTMYNIKINCKQIPNNVSPAILAVLILSFHVEHILHVQLEGLAAARAHYARPLVHLKSPASCE